MRLRLLAVLAATIVLTACSQPPHRATRTPSPAPSAARFVRVLFPGHRVVAYYGEADVPAMGVLGTSSAQRILPRLLRQAHAYAPYGEPVIPAFELIAVVAERAPGNADAYSVPIDSVTVRRYLDEIRKVHGLLILDVQPGRAPFLPYVKRYERFLREPDVSVAMDSEWSMGAGQVPGQVIGSTNAGTINAVSAYVSTLAGRYHLPQKLLIIHQFTSDMIERHQDVVMRPNLAIVFHVDGFGSRAGKLSKYQLLSHDRHGAFIGLKLFYEQDVDMFSAAQVMRLSPRPDLITYQ
ncbi:MAG TPA: hypothetical protein VFE17_06705 [Candidatus Baltobacteraceae bacterium]|nr:hypothetical protein [Candidatus Baltobacteraceae bacterium]